MLFEILLHFNYKQYILLRFRNDYTVHLQKDRFVYSFFLGISGTVSKIYDRKDREKSGRFV